MSAAETCGTNGSLPAKWLKARSSDFNRLGATSEFGSFVLAAAEVGFEVVVVVPVVVDVVSVPPGVVERDWGFCGTKALIVRFAWISPNGAALCGLAV